MATLADFKRAMVVGAKVRGGYFWKTKRQDISELEWRVVEKVQSNGVRLSGSFMDYPKANACDFDGKILKIYETGWRELNAEEKQALAEWHEIEETPEYKRQAEIDIMTDGTSTYYKEKNFFESKGLAHLFASTSSKYLDWNKYNRGEKYCVRDNSAQHGEQIAEYEIGE